MAGNGYNDTFVIENLGHARRWRDFLPSMLLGR